MRLQHQARPLRGEAQVTALSGAGDTPTPAAPRRGDLLPAGVRPPRPAMPLTAVPGRDVRVVPGLRVKPHGAKGKGGRGTRLGSQRW